ncbi:hypothetical protein [Rhizocola hellebori]|nr:hypothetical protein [Rhizocola hellebori]
MDKYGNSVLASFLLDVHVPNLPPPTQVVAYALELECSHEEFWLVKKDDAPRSPPQRTRCPIVWKCRLSSGRSAVRYLTPSEPEPKYAGMAATRWHVELDCGHDKPMLCHESESLATGEPTKCLTCQPEAMGFDVRITAVGRRLPDQMVQNWTVELNCGHTGIDHFIPVENADDPAAYRAARPRANGMSCLREECDQRQVRGVRRLGLIGKVGVPKTPPPAPLDPVISTANDVRRRLSKAQREELIRLLEGER